MKGIAILMTVLVMGMGADKNLAGAAKNRFIQKCVKTAWAPVLWWKRSQVPFSFQREWGSDSCCLNGSGSDNESFFDGNAVFDVVTRPLNAFPLGGRRPASRVPGFPVFFNGSIFNKNN